MVQVCTYVRNTTLHIHSTQLCNFSLYIYHYTYVRYKSPTTETVHVCDMRVVFMSQACCFQGVGSSLTTHACGYTHVHTQIVLHMRVPTCTQSIYT